MTKDGKSGRKTVNCPNCSTEQTVNTTGQQGCIECGVNFRVTGVTGGKIRAIGGQIVTQSGRLIR